MTFSELLLSLQDNPYFGAGFGLVGVGAGVAGLRRLSQVALVFFRRHYVMTLEVPCQDKSYNWLLQWITLNAKHTQHVSVETTYTKRETGKISTAFNFVPSVGTHFFNYKNTWLRVERNREQRSLDSPWETVTLTALGRNKELYVHILDEARNLALKSEEGKTLMYTAMGSEWRQFGHPRKRRPLSSVILDNGVSSRILQDVRQFINTPQWYSDRGIPYRRGYLLHGPPGCGKSSFITALAGELQYSICVLNLSDRGLTDDRLNYLMNIAPQESIILLEDIDAAFVPRKDSPSSKIAYEGLNGVTMSGLLNTLDGVASAEARIFFMTTNFLERLDHVLIRQGRVDVKEYIGPATEYQLKQMYRRFYPCDSVDVANQFSKSAVSTGKSMSMAAVQAHFMLHKDDPQGLMNNADKLEAIKMDNLTKSNL